MSKLKQSLRIYCVLVPLTYFVPGFIRNTLGFHGFPALAITDAVIVATILFGALPLIENLESKLKRWLAGTRPST